MCSTHWFKLPQKMRGAVWSAYTPGQEEGRAKVTQQYLFVTDEAIKWLLDQESRQGDLFK